MGDRFATCASTEGMLLRLHMMTAIDGSATAAWRALSEVRAHTRHVFWEAGFSYLPHRPALSGPGPARDDSRRRDAAPEQCATGAREAQAASQGNPKSEIVAAPGPLQRKVGPDYGAAFA